VFVNCAQALEEDRLETDCSRKATAEVGHEISTWGMPGLAAMLKARESSETTTVLTDALLFPGWVSPSNDVTDAVFT
jgi:hypothetical protein